MINLLVTTGDDETGQLECRSAMADRKYKKARPGVSRSGQRSVLEMKATLRQVARLGNSVRQWPTDDAVPTATPPPPA